MMHRSRRRSTLRLISSLCLFFASWCAHVVQTNAFLSSFRFCVVARRRRGDLLARRDADGDAVVADDATTAAAAAATRTTPLPPFSSLLSSNDPPSEPFTTWEDLLSNHRTRDGETTLASVPSFVTFCANHRHYARRLASSFAAESFSSSSSMMKVDPEEGFAFDLLKGGRRAGPIGTTSTPGQFVRVLMGFPDGRLTARPRHDVSSSSVFRHDDVRWITALTERVDVVRNEVRGLLASSSSSSRGPDDEPLDWDALRNVRGAAWSDTTGWSHLALADNFRRVDHNLDLLPRTARLLEDVVGFDRRLGPRLVALARQSARSGIPEHCDFMNFMLTLHLPLFSTTTTTTTTNTTNTNTNTNTTTKAGIVVNGTNHPWVEGEPLLIDTTFKHHTYNDGDADLYLLIVDFWHPDLDEDEIDALRHFFARNSGV